MTFKSQPLRKALPVSRALLLFLMVVLLEISGAWIYTKFIAEAGMSPLIFIGIQRSAGLGIVFIMLFIWKQGPADLGLSCERLKWGVIHGLLWSLGFGFFIGLFGIGLFLFGINPLQLFSHIQVCKTSDLLAFLLIGCLLGPAVEELVFTGILYNGLRARLNLALSVLIVATLFAFAHGFIAISLLIQFTGALLFTLSFEFSGSLLAPIIIHLCGNLAIFALQLR